MFKVLFPIVLFLASVSVFLGGCASTTGQGFANQNYDFSSLKKIAVVGVVGDVSGEAAKGQITNFFNQQLLRKGYSPIERQQIQYILAEQEFQGSGLTGTTGAVQIGKVLNVDAVILINVPRFDEQITMSAKMIDVEDASILWSASGSGRTGKGINTILGALAGGAAGAAAGSAASGGNSGITIASGAIGAGGGAIAGELLTPQKEEQARKMIEQLTESLPSSGSRN